MRAALAASVALALLIAPFAFGERVQEKDRRLEASGLARLGDRLLFVDDSVRGAYFSVPVERAEGVLELSRDAAQRHKLNGAREASDLEGIAVIDDEVFVLSEELHALFNAQGRVYEYALRFGPLAKRGMEGVALRRASNGVVEVAAVWEGGRYSKSALMPDLVPLLAGAVPQPIVVLHALCEGGAVGKQEEDDGARTVELLLAAAIDGAQGFRAKDLVWFTNAAGAHELIVLLTSRTETRLQRFDLAGRPVGRALDFGAWLAEHGLEKLRDKDWEGMTWWEPGEVLALVHDAARKGKTRVVFLPLPEALRRTPVVDEATRIHQSALVFDGHNDLPWVVREEGGGSFDELDIARHQPSLQTDIPRMRRGNLGAQFWSVYVPADTERAGTAAHQTLEQIELVHRMIERYPDTFELAHTADDVERIARSGRIASMIGIEGGYSIEESLALLGVYRRLGVRYMTLTHADTTAWADSATDDPEHGGLSPFGEEVVREMNRLGMLVDISHVSAETMHDALRVSQAPVIASHSCAYAVAPHARNIPDDVLELLPANGGVVMVNFYSGFVVAESARTMAKMFDARRALRREHADDDDYRQAVDEWRAAHPIERGTVSDVVDHIDHIVRVAGIDHVGLGSDFDGVTVLPEGLEDVSTYPAITRELLSRGYSEKAIRKVLGLNVLRALRTAEEVARRMSE